MGTDVKTFCFSMRDEMTGWKERVYDLIRKTEKKSQGPDREVKATIDDMKAIIDRIEQTLENLEDQCPADWDSEKAEIEQAMCEIKERWTEAADMSPDDLE